MSRRTLALLLGLGLVVVACSGGVGGAGSPTPLVTQLPDDPSHPYTITAIDYHFHDAHPTPTLSEDRTVRWTNQGTVTHNVTIPAIGFSEDLPVGATFEIRGLGKKLGGPGTYQFYCRFHTVFGMAGTIVIG
ncbi:MAG: cupredoxin domain-containing protein [Actinobacteria bacterium]|nr:cupredoxin domain-containing protein [Actinomycetota bacterium]